jgi:hypothetical protein
MLATVDDILALPGLANTPAIPTAWVNRLIGAADAHIKDWCNQELEMYYSEGEMQSGNTVRDMIARQVPIWLGLTTIDPAMNGLSLPQATITVASTTGFHPGLGGGTATPNNRAPGISIQTGLTTWAYVNYTGTTATTFTGCTGGTGGLSSTALKNGVTSPTLWWDSAGYGGQAPSSFAQTTAMALGTQFMINMDSGASRGLSMRGTIRRIGGAGQGFIGFYPENMYSGKLGAYRMPTWPRGDSNLKMSYTSGYPSYSRELRSLNYACVMLVQQMIRIQPSGMNLASESMGNYSYNVQAAFDTPEMGEQRRVLAKYRDAAWGIDQ